ncbi:Tryptophan 5-hydroxylase 1 [Trichinella zimbabwensis]|uniref:uS12 prolyl 3-hydroxylase n=1 Tax=Trichinella zimbabwensis TaxID=268475 RepID=A0A0V1I2H3_9BILA|nr:Tryptophan 5-hydroxylase 1 [Trichinella zimbabwensis]
MNEKKAFAMTNFISVNVSNFQNGEKNFPLRKKDLDVGAKRVHMYGKELDGDHPIAIIVNEEWKSLKLLKNLDMEMKFLTLNIHRKKHLHVYTQLKMLHQNYACKRYLRNFSKLEEQRLFSEENVPQLQDVSKFLKDCTGFEIYPVEGYLSAKDFLAGLAFRVFHTTQYVRHPSDPFYSPEPDVCHELLGHVPMFADPEFAQLSQEIGLASLGASETDINNLAKIYFFTAEFGVIVEDDQIKAYGAGLLSSAAELKNTMEQNKKFKTFDVDTILQTDCIISDYQNAYFVSLNIQDVIQHVRLFARTITRSLPVRYNAFIEEVEVLDNVEKLFQAIDNLKHEITCIKYLYYTYLYYIGNVIFEMSEFTKLNANHGSGIPECVIKFNQKYEDVNFRGPWLSTNEDVTAFEKPFKCAILRNFLTGNNMNEYFHILRKEILDSKPVLKQKDLFKFLQTKDFSALSSPAVEKLKSVFYGPVKEWFSKVTGIPLDDRVALAAQVYSHGHYLLCHDDRIGGRRIAFILNFTENSWTSDDGGLLELLECETEQYPMKVKHTIVPSENVLTCFEVVLQSFHQVSEIRSKTKKRFSIQGWYHGSEIEYPMNLRPLSSLYQLIDEPIDMHDEDLKNFINSAYLDKEVISWLNYTFEKESKMDLMNFFKDDVYNAMYREICSNSILWKIHGPMQKRLYYIAEENAFNAELCPTVSKLMFNYLAELTGLDNLAVNKDLSGGCGCKEEIRKFGSGCYSLIDADECSNSENEMLLEAIFHLVPEDWDEKYGGVTIFHLGEADEDEHGDNEYALPEYVNESNLLPNLLTLVYRDRAVPTFVKYVTKDVEHLQIPYFIDFNIKYVESQSMDTE